MVFIQNIKFLIVMLVLSVIATEIRGKPQQTEVIVNDVPSLDDEIPIDADSFPLAPDVPGSQGMRISGVDDYHIRK